MERGMNKSDAARNVALVVPLVLVNGFAVTGQLGWAREHLVPPDATPVVAWLIAGLFAAALESIALFLAAEAHAALMAGDSAWKLSLAARGAALLVGGLNYAHYVGQSQISAVTFGAMSAVSPWLWSVRSRSSRRSELRDKGLVDERTARFSTLRWLLHFRRTWVVWRSAVWAGEVTPAVALARFGGGPVVAPVPDPAVPERAASPVPIVEESAPELPPVAPAAPVAPRKPKAPASGEGPALTVHQAAELAVSRAPFPPGWYRDLQRANGGSDSWWKGKVKPVAQELAARPLRAVAP